ncbi:hypothetical protein [Stomatobaculum longum]|uniref:hypothetical protein n=1 Tax=Stomatobaculum longum TaxID=796942 RepID=UPI0028EF0576|nr:hypothetical protein [Stomatobaculum longum]
MAEFDLFDLVGLAFDPPETNAKQVKKKIEQKKAELGSALGRETQQTNRDAIQAQIDYLDGVVAQILTPDGKKLVDSAFKPLADQKTAAELSSLTATVELLAMTCGHTVTEASIRHYKKESRLSIEHVKKVFSDAGFEIIDKDPLAAFPKFPTNADHIYAELDALRKTKDPNPNGADTSVVVDLYSFAAYISNDTENIALYRAMETKELWEIFDSASRKYSQRNDNLGKLCGSLSAAAKAYVFNSDENRAAYERHLVYRSEELTKLFATMKKAPQATLLNSKFADPCIKIICNYFPDYDVALAIYNEEAGFTDNYYWPTAWVYTIRCSYCGSVSEFESEADALKANACRNCHKQLFKKCDKCGKSIPVFKDSCPHCGYIFASAALFSKFYQQAESAFRKNDFENARKYLFQAQSAAPGEKGRIDQLSAQIDKAEATLKEPINRLHQLIAERKYQTARAELGGIIKRYPSLNVSEFERVIKGELSKADALFASTGRMSASQKADICVSILMQCADHAPSLTFLRANAPTPCRLLNVTPVSDSGVINISWNRTTEQGVTYRLLRKNDGKGSTSERDGEILLDDTTATSYVDKIVKAGRTYSYSVFAARASVFSGPLSKSGMLYADVRNCHVVQHGSSIRITWDSPENSSGATVYRMQGGQTSVLSESAHGSFEDTTAQFGTTYTYRVCANYGRQDKSPGIEAVITPLVIIDSFSIRVDRVKDNIYKVTWSIKQKGIDLRIQVNNKLAAEVKSDDGSAQVSLPKDTYCTVSAAAYSGGKWLNSENSVGVNTYSACGIDKKATEIEENLISGRNGINYRIDLKIRMAGNIPSSVVGFYYTVRTSSASDRWAKADDIGKASDIQRITVDAYEKRGYIPFQDFVVNETAFFISVFTIHELNRKELVSESAKLKVERPLLANLFWSVSYGMFDGLKLHIEVEGNRPIEYVPELYLCVCDSGQFIAAYDDKNAQIIMKVPADDLDSPQKKYSRTYAVKTDVTSKYLKKCKYFLFESSNSGNDSISLRWKQGFSGKV